MALLDQMHFTATSGHYSVFGRLYSVFNGRQNAQSDSMARAKADIIPHWHDFGLYLCVIKQNKKLFCHHQVYRPFRIRM